MTAKFGGTWKELGGGEMWSHDLPVLRVEVGKLFKTLGATLKVYNVSKTFEPFGNEWPKPVVTKKVAGTGVQAGGHTYLEFKLNLKQAASTQMVVIEVPQSAADRYGITESVLLVHAKH